MAFEKLSTIVAVQVKYTTRAALAIVSGREEAFAPLDQVVVQIGGQPVIPGSSLKGAIRSAVESMLAERGIRVCVPESAIPKDRSRGPDKERYAQEIGRLPACKGRDPKVCPVCEIFGTVDLAARATFLDAKPVGTPRLIERSHVPLTRDNRAAAGGKLLKLQAVDGGTQFSGEIRLVNPEEWHVGTVLAGLKTLELTGLGGKKSSGYGDIEVRIENLRQFKWAATEWKDEPAQPEETYLQAFSQLRS